MIKSMLFDADGVVVDAKMFSIQYQKEHDVSNDEMLPFFKGDFQKCVVGQSDLMDEIEPWLTKWKWDGTAEEFLQYWFTAEHSVDEQVVEIIKELKENGIKCYLATNQEKYRAQYLEKQMGFGTLFDDMFLSSNIGHKKPERAYYEFILNEMKNKHNIEPQEIMFFDDAQENVDVAKELGIDSYFYKDFEEFQGVIKLILK